MTTHVVEYTVQEYLNRNAEGFPIVKPRLIEKLGYHKPVTTQAAVIPARKSTSLKIDPDALAKSLEWANAQRDYLLSSK